MILLKLWAPSSPKLNEPSSFLSKLTPYPSKSSMMPFALFTTSFIASIFAKPFAVVKVSLI